MKPNHALLMTALIPVLTLAASAQNPSAPPPPGAFAASLMATTAIYKSRISTVVYGPQGEVQALVLRNGVGVSVPPDLGAQLQASIVRGARVQVSGTKRVIAGQTSLLAQSVTENGQTMVASQPPSQDRGPAAAPPPPPGPPGPRGPADRRGPAGPPPPPPGSPDGAAAPAPPPPPPQM
jgi:hypothetical protein